MTEAYQATIKSILLASPPGQFDIILEDLRVILSKPKATGGPTLTDDSLFDANFVSAVRSEWESVTGRSVFEASLDIDTKNNEGFVTSLSKAMDDYLTLKFSSPGVRAAHEVTSSMVEGEETFTVAVYAERIDLHNHHAGSWKGCYTVCPSSGSLCGSISIWAHTFENGGNVQLHSDISPEPTHVGTCLISDDNDRQSAWAKAVTHQIESWEDNDVMESLAGMYESMSNNYLKSLRRVMPITRTKMEWNLMAHRLLQTLGESHDKEKFKH